MGRMDEPLTFKAKTVPPDEVPAFSAVPYSVFPARSKLPIGSDPSLPPQKLYSVVKSVPFVFSEKIVPLPELPPCDAVPYSVLPDRIRAAFGAAPSLLKPLVSVVEKL